MSISANLANRLRQALADPSTAKELETILNNLVPASPNTYTQTFSTADRTIANATAAALTVSDGAGTNDGTIGAITADASVIAAVQELAAQINKLVADNADLRQGLTAVIDDLQAAGIVG